MIVIRISYDVGGVGIDADISHVISSSQTRECAVDRQRSRPSTRYHEQKAQTEAAYYYSVI